QRALPSLGPEGAAITVRATRAARYENRMRRRSLQILMAGVAVIAAVALLPSAVRGQSARTLRSPHDFAGIRAPAARPAAPFVEAGMVLQHPGCPTCHP